MAHILVVDDNDEFRKMIREILEKAGYEITGAGNGVEAIKLYREKNADLVIMDMIMPEKDGLETMIELREEFPGVKIIAISGDGFEEPMNYLDGARLIGGAVCTFTKPFDIREFLQGIKEALKE